MAEILIQRKRRRSIWPWLLGLGLIIVAPLLLLLTWDRGPAPQAVVASVDTGAVGTPGPVADTSAVADTTAVPADSGARITATSAGALGSTRGDTTDSAAAAGVRTAPADASPAPSAATPATFADFVTGRRIAEGERANREYTAEALRRLATELRQLGATESGTREIRLIGDSLLMNTRRRNASADYARTAFLSAVRELDALRARHRVTVDTARLRRAAWAIQPSQPLNAQRPRVQAFFDAARGALTTLAGRTR